jgi:large-conductance mechanosensitive channel
MRKLPLSLGLGMVMALATGLSGLFSVSGAPYMSAGGAAAAFVMDWGGLLVNIVAWIVVVYAVLFVVEKVRR